jgi:spermidine synthase
MYHVFTIAITTAILYLLSILLCHRGFYSQSFNRKIWNIVLGSTFIITALAGIFLALQFNYKWEIPQLKTILRYHVEFGTGLSVTGIMHFLRHISYFTKKTPLTDKHQVTYSGEEPFENIGINIFLTGFISTAIQLLLLREMINISGGYELIAGVFLGSWLIISSAGASLARSTTKIDLKKANLMLSVSPVCSLILLFIFTKLYLNTGETPSFLTSLVITLLTLLPVCLISGFIFIRLTLIANTQKVFSPGKSYTIDTSGGILSGITIVFLTAGKVGTYTLLFLLIILYLSYVMLNFYVKRKGVSSVLKVVILIISCSIVLFKTDVFFRQFTLPGIKLTNSLDTPYGNISTSTNKNETSIYYNHRLISFNDDVIEREENIHYALLQSDSPESIILISGDLNSNLAETRKYKTKKIIYIEQDPTLADLYLLKNKTDTNNLSIIRSDAISYLKKQGTKADVILLLIPPPSTIQLNRYYTTEFFWYVKTHLTENGIFMCSPGPGDNYLNKESINLYSSVFNSLKVVFKNVVPITGNKLYLISSDKNISSSICQLISEKNVINTYVSKDYLSDDIITTKSKEVLELLKSEKVENTYSHPLSFFNYQLYFLSKNRDEKTPSVILLLVLFATPLIAVNKKNRLIFFSASALAGFEIILLVTIQIIIGNMYQITGLVMAGIMGGLAIGAGRDIMFLRKYNVSVTALILIILYLLFSICFIPLIKITNEFLATILILAFSVFPALLTGNLYRVLLNNETEAVNISGFYSSDLAGSALGFIAVSCILLPYLGIKNSAILLAGFIFTGILFGSKWNKH